MLLVDYRQVEFIHFVFRQADAFRQVQPGSFTGQHFTRRGNQQLVQVARGALRGRVESADGVDLIPKELQARRFGLRWRPHIQNAAAVRELPRLQHGIRRLVAQV